MEWAEVTLELLEANCPADVLKAYSDKVLAGFDERIAELEAEIQESAAAAEEAAAEVEREEAEEEAVAESKTTEIEARLAAVEMRERQADAREVVQASLAEANITDLGKQMVKRQFADAAPDNKEKFIEAVAAEIKAVAEHEKAIAESVRLPGTPGVIREAGAPDTLTPEEVRADIARAAGAKPEEK